MSLSHTFTPPPIHVLSQLPHSPFVNRSFRSLNIRVPSSNPRSYTHKHVSPPRGTRSLYKRPFLHISFLNTTRTVPIFILPPNRSISTSSLRSPNIPSETFFHIPCLPRQRMFRETPLTFPSVPCEREGATESLGGSTRGLRVELRSEVAIPERDRGRGRVSTSLRHGQSLNDGAVTNRPASPARMSPRAFVSSRGRPTPEPPTLVTHESLPPSTSHCPTPSPPPCGLLNAHGCPGCLPFRHVSLLPPKSLHLSIGDSLTPTDHCPRLGSLPLPTLSPLSPKTLRTSFSIPKDRWSPLGPL